MSSMKRLITYLYHYDHNNKEKNAGFSKIEILREQVRIEIHLRKCGYTGINGSVYLCAGNHREIHGLEIGKIQILNGTGDLRLALPESQIAGSSYSIQDIHGMLITVDGSHFFMSQWDDLELSPGRIILEKKGNIVEFPEKKLRAAEQPELSERMPLPIPGQRNPLPVPEMQIPEQEREMPMPEQREPMQEREMPMPEQRMPMPEQEMPMPEQRMPMPEREIPMPDRIPNGSSTLSQSDQRWQQFAEKYPVIEPFKNQPEVKAVKIDLKDIRELPREYWYLGNNSFLLHGFFNYRYLILGRMMLDGEEKWFLGVPGIYQNQERMMANIFGFPEYRPEEDRDYLMGSFGYWIKPLSWS